MKLFYLSDVSLASVAFYLFCGGNKLLCIVSLQQIDLLISILEIRVFEEKIIATRELLFIS